MKKKIELKIKKGNSFILKEAIFTGKETFEDLINQYKDEALGRIVLVRVGNRLEELTKIPEERTKSVTYLDTTDLDGHRVYMRSLSMVLCLALERLDPELEIEIAHSISTGLYCRLKKHGNLLIPDSYLKKDIINEMTKICQANYPIIGKEMTIKEAVNLFKSINREEKVNVYKYRKEGMASIYEMDGYIDSFFGFMVPSSAYVSDFDIEIFSRGIVLVGPKKDERGRAANFKPQYLLSESYLEEEAWSKLQGIKDVYDLNRILAEGKIGEVVRMTEALQDHKVMEIAEEIYRQNKKIILIAAPSSSGKSSFAYKLTSCLRVLGLRPVKLSTDDYYVNRVDTPLGDDGKPDFESINAVDLNTLNQDLKSLLRGREIEKIIFDFISGSRIKTGEKLSIPANAPIIIEGIHALNPLLAQGVDKSYKYKIYISVTTHINLDPHNRIPTSDLRLMRRISRDAVKRGTSAEQTILSWPSVRRGEERNIFPYEAEADIVFDSSFVYEIAALKPLIEPLLEEIGQDKSAYIEAVRLKSLLRYFLPMNDLSDIVNTSILREFVGGSKIVD